MQPYIFPYIGYFQLISAADHFIFFDDVNYIQRGWINRNRILVNETSYLFTIPLENASQNTLIKDIKLFQNNRSIDKLLKTIYFSYKKAPFFSKIYPLLESFFKSPYSNIVEFNIASIKLVYDYIGGQFSYSLSSTLTYNRTTSGIYKIVSIANYFGAKNYINPPGAGEMYVKKIHIFEAEDIKLKILKIPTVKYKQYKPNFISHLSIIDILMFNSIEDIHHMIQDINFKIVWQK